MDTDYLPMSIKKSFSIEYDFHASPQLLFQYLSTPSGLSEWFALLLQKKNNDKVKFQWQNDEEDDGEYYFEFKIQVDEITKDVSLIVTDFAEEDELEESKMLWDNLVSDLKQVLGAS